MGNIADSMQKTMEKNGDNMYNKQRELMMKQRQVQLAMQFASGREMFQWYSVFLSIVVPVLIIGAIRGTRVAVAPLIPLSFVWAYQYDLFYGNKMVRIRAEAERMIKEEPERFFMPKGNLIIDHNEYLKILKIQEKPNQD